MRPYGALTYQAISILLLSAALVAFVGDAGR